MNLINDKICWGKTLLVCYGNVIPHLKPRQEGDQSTVRLPPSLIPSRKRSRKVPIWSRRFISSTKVPTFVAELSAFTYEDLLLKKVRKKRNL